MDSNRHSYYTKSADEWQNVFDLAHPEIWHFIKCSIKSKNESCDADAVYAQQRLLKNSEFIKLVNNYMQFSTWVAFGLVNIKSGRQNIPEKSLQQIYTLRLWNWKKHCVSMSKSMCRSMSPHPRHDLHGGGSHGGCFGLLRFVISWQRGGNTVGRRHWEVTSKTGLCGNNGEGGRLSYKEEKGDLPK